MMRNRGSSSGGSGSGSGNNRGESEVIDVGRRRSSCGYCKSSAHTSITYAVSSVRVTGGNEHWTKPEINKIKINVDAALFKNEQRYGFGCVARDHNGAFLEAKSGSYVGKVTAELAEALGFKEALSWAKAKNWNEVVIETDCSSVIQALHSPVNLVSNFGLVIEDCKQLVHEFAKAECFFVKRSANRVAHCLARQSCLFSDRSFILSNAPMEVLSLCMDDLN